MSEERGKRDGRSEEFENSSAPDDVAPGSEGRLSDADTTADDAAAGAVAPTGKRASGRSRGSAAGVSMTKAAPAKATPGKARSGKAKLDKRPNVFLRLLQFFREVVAELRKVIWPNKKQMVTYTTVVLVFLAFMVAFISGLDLLFIKGVGWLFG
ncbi:preprotein translocase subunit SecE [Rhodococcoides fascians]|uniref:preprotein translocase subunit SecE n=1 Tax=Nocardiaceae TaxID=85025 RepID=UPI000708F675|nr:MULTISPECIES: preprotein translocase subunit SecE [Rhodococcus]KQU37779.1 preprotein translocase subunit SecE [Rhodococcus sp. Leaf233]MDI9931705.1 preprotein translocase subunit SecE [Rhodococcus sp. IEGM 1354]OZE27808.1 preprotein translocase subunit SecE [Rhodococcus sp. 05-2255-1e]OZE88729.1 preprotein translocase subunit SecE [Rhodococcus fascians]OZF16690.1 preprotein translocase subunit SecE [Rhodococcus fascians]